MLRTLPTKRPAELEALLPQALNNAILVNGLECKLNNQTSKVSENAASLVFDCAE